ncbi:hypothetical protein LINGRAPRIM_LOCUS3230 [Linum grandiflorum]
MACECEHGDNCYVVDMINWTCTWGHWKLSGVPCVHAITTASHLRKHIYY